MHHDWPGNVRELRNVLERALLFANTSVLAAGDLGTLGMGAERRPSARGLTLREAERHHIQETLLEFSHDVSKSADALGVSRSALYKKLRRHGIDLPSRSQAASSVDLDD